VRKILGGGEDEEDDGAAEEEARMEMQDAASHVELHLRDRA
jgi:hypothetical protein